VALVVVAGDVGQHAHLRGGHQTIGHRDAQHGRVALDVQAVLQAQRAEFFFLQLTGQIATGLVAELPDALLDDVLIVLVVNVHKGPVNGLLPGRARSRATARWGRQDSSIVLCAKVKKKNMFITKIDLKAWARRKAQRWALLEEAAQHKGNSHEQALRTR